MQKRFSAGRTTIFKDERGTILAITAVVTIMMVVLFAGIAEFGRYLIMREQTQTAGEAAALAGIISGGDKYVKIEVTTDLGKREVCDTDCWWEYDEKGNRHRECDTECWWESCGGTKTKTATGKERDLIDNDGWKNYCASPCSGCDGYKCDFKVLDMWVEYEDSDVKTAARDFFNANSIDQSIWAEIKKIKINDGKRGAAPYVLIYAKSKMESLFPGLFGVFPETYETETCSQGDTTYRDLDTNKWMEAPPDACWKD